MYQTLKEFIFYDEKMPFLRRNAFTISLLGFVELAIVLMNVIQGDYQLAIVDIPVFLFLGFVWWCVKIKRVYYVNISFLIMVPLLSALIVHSAYQKGLVGIIWCYPILVLLFFCLNNRLAQIASGVIFLVTMCTSYYFFTTEETIRIGIALFMILVCCILVFNNVFRQYDYLENKAVTDPMTGLLNRALLKEKLQQSMENSNSYPAVLFNLDVDHFKKINDTYGHQAGDEALIQMTQLLKSVLRKTDVVFRLGGEEFLILVEDISLAEATKLATSLRKRVADFVQPNHKFKMTVSIGVAQYIQNEDWDSWINRADDAMYQAKNNGRNQVRLA